MGARGEAPAGRLGRQPGASPTRPVLGARRAAAAAVVAVACRMAEHGCSWPQQKQKQHVISSDRLGVVVAQTIVDLEEHVVEQHRRGDHVGLVHLGRAGRELDAVVVRVRADRLEDLAGRLGREVRDLAGLSPISRVAEVALSAELGAAAEERGPVICA